MYEFLLSIFILSTKPHIFVFITKTWTMRRQVGMNKKGRKKNIQNYFMAAINLRFSVLFSRFVCAILFSLLLCLAFFFGLNGRFAYFLRALYVYSFVRALFYMKAENKNHLINPQTRIAILNCFSISFRLINVFNLYIQIYTDIMYISISIPFDLILLLTSYILLLVRLLDFMFVIFFVVTKHYFEEMKRRRNKSKQFWDEEEVKWNAAKVVIGILFAIFLQISSLALLSIQFHLRCSFWEWLDVKE